MSARLAEKFFNRSLDERFLAKKTFLFWRFLNHIKQIKRQRSGFALAPCGKAEDYCLKKHIFYGVAEKVVFTADFFLFLRDESFFCDFLDQKMFFGLFIRQFFWRFLRDESFFFAIFQIFFRELHYVRVSTPSPPCGEMQKRLLGKKKFTLFFTKCRIFCFTLSHVRMCTT